MVAAAAGAAVLVSVGLDAAAQAYPNRPIRLISPAPPGGGTDAITRVLADGLAATLKQSVIVDNKPGANGIIASEAAAKAPADGYTLMVIVNTHTVNPALVRKLPYDTLKDFTAIAGLAQSPYVVVSAAATGVKSIKGLVDLAKTSPGSMFFGASEGGMRLTAARLGRVLDIPVTNVSYKGTGPMMADMAGGHLNFTLTSIASTLPFRTSGKINFVAVTSPARNAAVPEVATLTEQGVSNFDAAVWYALVAPANTPAELVQEINRATRAAMATEEAKKKLVFFAMEPWTFGPGELASFLGRELALNLKAAKEAGIEPE